MMRRFHVGLVAVVLVAAAATGHSFSSYAKWPSSPVTFYVNPATSDVSPAAAAAATQFALDVWNWEALLSALLYGGTSSDTATGFDNRNVVFFRNASNGGAIASTYSWWDGSNRLLDSDVIVWDGAFTFFTGTSGCGGVSNAAYLEDILTHEFGHALGLNHSGASDATMYPSYGYCSQEMRTLASDDIAGIQSLYGASSKGGSTGNTSPDGTTVPGATQIVDNLGAVWTIGASGAILRNGLQAAYGWGSTILWTSGTIYVCGGDYNWWRWTGSGWVNSGPQQPGGTTPGGNTSPDGTTVPGATQIVDNLGAVWTIGGSGAILRNGLQAAYGWGSTILWTSSTIYVRGGDNNWWRWTGSGWVNSG